MIHRLVVCCGVASALLVGSPGAAAGQGTELAPVNRDRILDAVRVGRGLRAHAIAYLTGAEKTSAERDEFADSLVSIARRVADEQPAAIPDRIAMNAVGILGRAGKGEQGRAYPKALEKLMMIVDSTRSQPLKGAAMSRIMSLGLPDAIVAREFERVLLVDGAAASQAYRLLLESLGAPGLAALRRTYERGLELVPFEYTRRALAYLAATSGW